VLGILTGFWGGSLYPASFRNEDFMAILTGASLLVTAGVPLIPDIPKWIVIGALYLTLSLAVIYTVLLGMGLWLTLMAIAVLAGPGWWLTGKILGKSV
jgi:hypothetical protein